MPNGVLGNTVLFCSIQAKWAKADWVRERHYKVAVLPAQDAHVVQFTLGGVLSAQVSMSFAWQHSYEWLHLAPCNFASCAALASAMPHARPLPRSLPQIAVWRVYPIIRPLAASCHVPHCVFELWDLDVRAKLF